MSTITRSGRISKRPDRLEPEEPVEDDYEESEDDADYTDDEEDLCETDDEDEDDSDADENGNLKGFVVDDEDA